MPASPRPGEPLAQRWGLAFRDTDADVEQQSGKTIADIFVDDGEPRFRELERSAVHEALQGFDGVLAVGGGAILDAGTRELLREHRVVFLDVELADAVKRIGLNRDRPLLLGNPRAQLHALMQARRPLYEEVATVVVSTTGKSADAVADEIAEALP